MGRMVLQGVTAVLLAALVALAPGVAAEVIIVDGSEVTAERADDGGLTAKVSLINPTDAEVPLPTPTTEAESCTVAYAQDELPPLAVTPVTLELASTCLPEDGSVPTIAVDLDGAAGSSPITVKSPSEKSDWEPLWWAAGIALVGTLVMVWRAAKARRETEKELQTKRSEHEKEYGVFAQRLTQWADVQPPIQLTFAPLPPSDYGFRSPVSKLDAGWSFSESWVSNVTAVTAGVVTIVTSTDAFGAVLGSAPKTLLGVMATAGLVSAVLLGVANATVKLLGKDVSQTTVGGLLVSSALITFAALLQVATITIGAADAVDSRLARAVIAVAGAVVAVVALVYITRTLNRLIRRGADTKVPVPPADAHTVWAAKESWQRELVADRLVQDYAPLVRRAGTPVESVASVDTGGGYPTRSLIPSLEGARASML